MVTYLSENSDLNKMSIKNLNSDQFFSFSNFLRMLIIFCATVSPLVLIFYIAFVESAKLQWMCTNHNRSSGDCFLLGARKTRPNEIHQKSNH